VKKVPTFEGFHTQLGFKLCDSSAFSHSANVSIKKNINGTMSKHTVVVVSKTELSSQ